MKLMPLYRTLLVLFGMITSFFALSQTTIYSENFETKTAGAITTNTQGWSVWDGTSSINTWAFTSTNPLTGSYSLGVWDGTTYDTYNKDDDAVRVAYYATTLSTVGYMGCKLSFSWKCTGEGVASKFDYFEVVYSTNGTTWNTLTSTKYNQQSTKQTVTDLNVFTIDENASFYIGFRWTNDGDSGSDPPAMIDDIVLTGNTVANLYSEDFEGKTVEAISTNTQGWSVYTSTTSVNDWVFTSTSPITGTYSLAIWNGTTHGTYNKTDNGVKVAYYATALDATNYSGLKISFSWKCYGERISSTDYDYIELVYSTNTTTWNLVSATKYNLQSTTQTVTDLDLSALDGSSFYIGYRWTNDVSGGTDPPAMIDDIVINGGVPTSAPTLDATTAATSITNNSASSGGNVTSDGGDAVTARGACWNTSTSPTTANSTTSDGTGTGSFSSSLTGLSAETQYYVRSYATNSVGTSYGAEINFWTLSTEPSGHSATFTSNAPSETQIDLTFNAASTYGADGYIILRKDGATAPDGTNVDDASAPGSLSLPGGTTLLTTITNNATTSFNNTGLTAGTQYSYCIIPYNYNGANNETYNYYTAATIPTTMATTLDLPTVTTSAVSSVSVTTASGGGNVTSEGGSSVTARGVCWNTSTDPTTANSKTTNGSGSGAFASSLTGLSAETYYYVRAYATNTDGTSYGSNVEFWTLSAEPTGHSSTFTSNAPSETQIDLTFNAASTYGADGYIILRKDGATAPDGTNVDDASAPGSLSLPGGTTLLTTITNNATTSFNNTGLTAGTQYSYCIIPYNYNGANNETYNYYTAATIPTTTATTLDLPTVTTSAVSSVSVTTASGGGNVTSEGGSSVTERGVCWNTSTDPTTANSKTTDGSGSGAFASSLTGLSAETYYYVRAYATNTDGTSYGSNVEFWTLSAEPTGHSAIFSATTASPTQINLSFSAASTYGADGYIILRKTGATAPDETNVNDGSAPGSLSLPGGTTLVTTITSSSTTSYSNSGLSQSTQYYYTIIPFNYNGSNDETYNYYTAATIPTATATTTVNPSSEGVNISGNFTNNGTLIHTNDVNYMTLSGTAKSISGTGIYTNVKVNINGSITFTGAVSSGSFDEVFISSAKSLIVDDNKSITNVALSNSGTLTLNTGSTFNNSGNWANGGTVTANSTSTVVFNGSSTQAILSGGSDFGRITFNNTDATGITLNDEVTANDLVTFTDGVVASNASNPLTFSTSATVTGASAASHVNGPVKKLTNSATEFIFPVGNGTKYRSIAITPTSTGATTWRADYNSSVYGDVSVTGAVNHVSGLEYWNLDRISGSETATIKLSWDASSGADANYSEIIVAHYNGTDWETCGGNSHTGDATAGTVTSNAAWNSYSPFTLASSTVNNPLPVNWLKTEAVCSDNLTLINWTTASENNNDYFIIEKSLDGENFEPIGVIDGAGNSNNIIQYSYSDNNPGKYYYRIKQTDFDGSYSHSMVFSSSCGNLGGIDLQANGSKENGRLDITIQSPTSSNYTLSIYDHLGQLIKQERIIVTEGVNKYNIPLINHANGIYFISLFNDNGVITKKFYW